MSSRKLESPNLESCVTVGWPTKGVIVKEFIWN